MKHALTLLFLLVISWSFNPTTSWAQESDQPLYYVVDYMKVAPDKTTQYLELEAIWKKLHAARIEMKQLDGWMLQRIASPSGTHAEYNYVTVNHYVGNTKLAGHFESGPMGEEIRNALTDKEWEMVNTTAQVRDLVKSEVWRYRGGVFAEKMEDTRLHVFNYFEHQAGMSGADHTEIENKIWKPIMEARIKDGSMKGWGIYSLEIPYGSKMPYDDATIDFYTGMDQFLQPWVTNYFADVHPGKDPDAAFAETLKVADLIRAEIRMTIDQIGF